MLHTHDAGCAVPTQNALPGLLTPGRGWAGRVFEAGVRGLYQHMRNLGLEPGEEMLAAMQVGHLRGN